MTNKETHLIILAAGKSSRMKTNKSLMKIQDIELINQQINAFQKQISSPITIISGENHNRLKKLLAPKITKIAIVSNQQLELGPIHSIRLGIDYILSTYPPEKIRGCFILPVDTPIFKTDIYNTISNNIKNSSMVLKPSYNKKSGHPIYLSYKIMKTLLKDSSINRLDHFIKNLPKENIDFVEVNSSEVLLNLNTPKDVNFFIKNHL